MACNQETLLLLSSYVDGEATPEEAARARAHLERCTECRELVEDWQRQRELFQWAFRFELPEVTDLDFSESASQSSTPKRERKMKSRPPINWKPWNWQWSWRTAGTLAAVVFLMVIIHHFVTLPPKLSSVGNRSVHSGKVAQVYRTDNGTVLELAPGTQIKQEANNWISLEKGWVRASVGHGDKGFRITTQRIDVTDLGTRFGVGSGSDIDCVLVEQGKVRVNQGKLAVQDLTAGQVLISDGSYPPSIIARPKPPSVEDKGSPLTDRIGAFAPTTSDNLDWEEGVRKLTKRLPDLRWAGVRLGGDAVINGRRFHLSIAPAASAAAAVSLHFGDILRGSMGAYAGSDWDIPVAYAHLDNISKPVRVGPGMYYIQLAAQDGRMFWRLTGSQGRIYRFPVTFKQVRDNRQYGGISETPTLQVRDWIPDNQNGPQHNEILLKEWPGDIKPALVFDIEGVPLEQCQPDIERAKAAFKKQIAGLKSFMPIDGSLSHFYLDPARKHSLVHMWNDRMAAELAANWNREARQNYILGVFKTDIPLSSPALPAGTYLIMWNRPGPDYSAKLELARMEDRKSLVELKSSGSSRNGNGGAVWSADWETGIGQFEYEFVVGDVAEDSYPFGIRVYRNKTRNQRQEERLAEGWFSVKKP